MNRHQRRAQSAGTKTVACRIRARIGADCLFCELATGLRDRQEAFAIIYFLGHRDEVAATGPFLCQSCIDLVRMVSDRFADGQVLDMNAPGAGKA